jgi:hypothetical protein
MLDGMFGDPMVYSQVSLVLAAGDVIMKDSTSALLICKFVI